MSPSSKAERAAHLYFSQRVVTDWGDQTAFAVGYDEALASCWRCGEPGRDVMGQHTSGIADHAFESVSAALERLSLAGLEDGQLIARIKFQTERAEAAEAERDRLRAWMEQFAEQVLDCEDSLTDCEHLAARRVLIGEQQ